MTNQKREKKRGKYISNEVIAVSKRTRITLINLNYVLILPTWLDFRVSELLVIGHVRYINIPTWLRGFQVKLLYLVLFSLYLSLLWELRDKRTLTNLQFLPESLGAMLEY